MKAFARLGAKDFYNIPLYEKLFRRMRFTPKLLRCMYVNEKMRTSTSSNGLTIWGKEDSWRLAFRGDGDARKLMNNKLLSVAGWHTDVYRRVSPSGGTGDSELRICSHRRVHL